MLSLTIEVDTAPLNDDLIQFASTTLIDLRRLFTRNLTQRILSTVITLNPIDTGRSRSAWVNALEQLGGTPPAGWDASSTNPIGISQGFAHGSGQFTEASDTHEAIATNTVDYINVLEFGTSRQQAHNMVSRSLLSAVAQLHSF